MGEPDATPVDGGMWTNEASMSSMAQHAREQQDPELMRTATPPHM